MTPPERAAAQSELAAAASVLSAIIDLHAADRNGGGDEHLRLHARYLWIVVGSRLKNYCATVGIDRASGTFAAAIGMRHKLAYSHPDDIDDDIVRRAAMVEGQALDLAIDDASAALRSV